MRKAVACAAVALLAGCAGSAAREQQHLVPLHAKLVFAEIGVDEQHEAVAELDGRSRDRALAELDALPPEQDAVVSPWALVRRDQILADANHEGEDPAVAAMIGQLGKWEGDPASVPRGGVARTPILRSQTALIADRSLDIGPGFLDLLAKNYDMGVYLAKPGDPELPEAVNQWASGTTSDRFLHPMPGLGSPHGVYLADSTALLAGWQFPFLPEFAEERVFVSASGQQRRASIMRGPAFLRTATGPGWRAAQFPLADGVEMRLVVPADPKARLAGLVPPARDALSRASPAPLGLALPRWSARTALSGEPAPQDRALLSRLAPQAWLSGWTSQAAVAFGPNGVSVAPAPAPASTTAAHRAESPPPVAFAADRPFYFEILDPGTGLLLLAGRAADPGR